MQRNARETTAGASKRRPRPTACAVAAGNLSGPPRRGLKRPREAGIRAKPQREHRNATECARNHSGSIETQRNSCETTAGASKPWPPQKKPRAKPQREHRSATEFARNHSGSVETQRNSRETTAGASTRRPHPTACAVAVGNLKFESGNRCFLFIDSEFIRFASTTRVRQSILFMDFCSRASKFGLNFFEVSSLQVEVWSKFLRNFEFRKSKFTRSLLEV